MRRNHQEDVIRQRDIQRIFEVELGPSEMKTQSELREIVRRYYPSIRSERVSHAIWRAHDQESGNLNKVGRYYKLRSDVIGGVPSILAHIEEIVESMGQMVMDDFGNTGDKMIFDMIRLDLSQIVSNVLEEYQ